MVINQIQQEIIGSDFFKVWVMSFHCAVPLVEFKGTAETVFFALSQDSVTCQADSVCYCQSCGIPGRDSGYIHDKREDTCQDGSAGQVW